MGLTNQVRPAPIIIATAPPRPTETPLPTPAPITIFINGEVKNPNLYELPHDARLIDAITAAGGLTADANEAVVNLAHPLQDGNQIYIRSLTEITSPPPVVSEQSTSQTTQATTLININTANQTQLETLPSIGPSTAQKIIDYRNTNGDFASLDAIMDVSGIGPATFEKLKELITIQ